MTSAEEQIRRQVERMRATGVSGIPDEALAAYDLGRALAGAATPHGARGFEAEVSQELDRQLSGETRLGADHRRLLIPPAVIFSPQATLTTDSASEWVHPEVRTPVRRALRPIAAVQALGATIIRDAPAGVRLVRVAAGLELVWIPDELPDDAADEEVPIFAGGAIPIRLGRVDTWATRMLERQSPELGTLLERDVRAGAVALLDQAAIAGTGQDGQPLGILGQSGVVPLPSGGVPTWDLLTRMEELAHEDGGLPGWVTTPAVRRALRKLPEIGAGGAPAWRNGRLLDAPALVSSHVPAEPDALIYSSSWADLVVQVVALEVVPDPFTLAARGLVRFRVFLHCGVGTWHSEAFVKTTDIVLDGGS